MKEWPYDKTETANYEDIVDPVRKLFKQILPKVNWKKLSQRQMPTWTGLPFGISIGSMNPHPENQLTTTYMESSLARDRDILDVLIHITFGLAVEQGERMAAQKNKHIMELAFRKLGETPASYPRRNSTTGPQWPVDETEPLTYTEITTPIRKVFAQLLPKVNWKALTRLKEFPKWTGLPFGRSIAVCNFHPDEKLTPEYMAHEIEQGRDILDSLIHITFGLGVEQGERMFAKREASVLKIGMEEQDRLLAEPREPLTAADKKRVQRALRELLAMKKKPAKKPAKKKVAAKPVKKKISAKSVRRAVDRAFKRGYDEEHGWPNMEPFNSIRERTRRTS